MVPEKRVSASSQGFLRACVRTARLLRSIVPFDEDVLWILHAEHPGIGARVRGEASNRAGDWCEGEYQDMRV